MQSLRGWNRPRRGKSGLHRGRMIVNGDQGKPSGKCHRKQTASGMAHKAAWGKGETGS